MFGSKVYAIIVRCNIFRLWADCVLCRRNTSSIRPMQSCGLRFRRLQDVRLVKLSTLVIYEFRDESLMFVMCVVDYKVEEFFLEYFSYAPPRWQIYVYIELEGLVCFVTCFVLLSKFIY